MAAMGANRFALFAESDENSSATSPVSDVARNPFVNQVADNSNPWQEVKKRGGGVAQIQVTDQHQRPKTLVIRDENRAALNRNRAAQQTRNISSSTIDSEDRLPDPHENWCGVCSHKFPSKSALQSHVKQSPNHQHYCNLCKRVFKDRNGLKNHVDNSWGHEIFCNLCLSAFKDQWGLKNHFENNYSVDHGFVCLTCLLGFRSQRALEQHLQTGEKHVWCNTCHRKFRNQDERDAHWLNTSKHKHCMQPGCDFDAPNMNVLEKHLKEDHFQCEGCKRIFPSQTKLNAHHETCSFNVPCPNSCGETFPGQVKLAIHLESCFYCAECGFRTSHEGNYNIHMTKHISATFTCWACSTPLRTLSSLINHLESGACPDLPNPTLLSACLGHWWYSPLFMDIDIHVQIRTGRIDFNEMQDWMKHGLLHPFICRAEGCQKTFAHLSSLVLHVESQACEWDVERLRLDWLEKEFMLMCLRRDSAVN